MCTKHNSFTSNISLRSTKEERFLISWATCDRVGVLCTQAKADPCFFVRSAGRSSFQRHFEWRHNFVAQRMLPRASQFVGRSRTGLCVGEGSIKLMLTFKHVFNYSLSTYKHLTTTPTTVKLAYVARWTATTASSKTIRYN